MKFKQINIMDNIVYNYKIVINNLPKSIVIMRTMQFLDALTYTNDLHMHALEENFKS